MTRSRSLSGHPVWIAAVGLSLSVLVTLGGPPLATASEGGGGGLIELNRSLFVQVLNFLLLLVLLYRFAYRPLVGALEARSAAIKQQLAEAQAAREQAQRQQAEFEGRLQAAHGEAQALRERALREAAETRERLTADARQEATRLLEAARAEIDQDVRRAKSELRAEVGALAIQIAERLIQKSLRDEDQERLVREALARMDAR
ncbi:MAG TPA: F0F1 ATP synthase subunit B [Methylomirabilota bacterium]|nr:F0F1 ATP synthase subunit B [Methylomirabilota bacterium]